MAVRNASGLISFFQLFSVSFPIILFDTNKYWEADWNWLREQLIIPTVDHIVSLYSQAWVLKMWTSLSRILVCPLGEMLMVSLGSHKYMAVIESRFFRMVCIYNILYCQNMWPVLFQKTLYIGLEATLILSQM